MRNETLRFIMTHIIMTHNLPRSSAVVILVPKRINRIENPKQESTIHTTPEHSFDLLVFFRCHINTRFGISIDIRGVDYPSREQRLRVIHQLPTIRYKSCVCIKISLNEITLVSSVISISSSAGRWEREVWDMFGIRFSNYPELRRILTDYGFESHPLRKDFPLSGYVEVRYDDSEKCVISERLEMAQEFRYSDLTSPWKLTLSRHLSTKRYYSSSCLGGRDGDDNAAGGDKNVLNKRDMQSLLKKIFCFWVPSKPKNPHETAAGKQMPASEAAPDETAAGKQMPASEAAPARERVQPEAGVPQEPTPGNTSGTPNPVPNEDTWLDPPSLSEWLSNLSEWL